MQEEWMLIHEIAKRLHVTPRTIRFYEEAGLIAPRKDPENQYRLFSLQDAWRLQAIVALREVGMSLPQVREVIGHVEENRPSSVEEYLEIQRSVMFQQWIQLKQMIETADGMIEVLKSSSSLEPGALFQLAEALQRLRGAREEWRDVWNFDQRAERYDQTVEEESKSSEFEIHGKYSEALQLVFQLIAPVYGEIGLDFGVGTGNLAGVFVKAGIRMAGVDQSRPMLVQCKEKYPSIEAKLGSFFAVPFFDDSFHFVVSSFAFQHLSPQQCILALEDMDRVLKPHGRVCIADLMFRDGTHRVEYLERLEREGRQNELGKITSIYVHDLARLTDWFRQHGFVTQAHAISPLLNVVYALRAH